VSSGVGHVMTEQLLARGDCVAGTVRDLSVMDSQKAEHRGRLWLLDLSETGSIHGVVDYAWTALVVVSNAGYGLTGAAVGIVQSDLWSRRLIPSGGCKQAQQ
jgi:short-subunit dehydrogenase